MLLIKYLNPIADLIVEVTQTDKKAKRDKPENQNSHK